MTGHTKQEPRLAGGEDASLRGKVAIVTGASRGIGAAIALELAQAGVDSVIVARDEAMLNSVAERARSFGTRVEVVAGDLRNVETVSWTIDRALAAFQKIDILVNNAGATTRGHFLELPDSDWEDGFGLKFFGAMRLCRAAWPTLVQTSGSVVNIAGAGGRTPDIYFAIGSPVNAALNSFSKFLAELGIRDGVRVNCINPGLVRTDRLTKRLTLESRERRIDPAEMEYQLSRELRIARIGEPEDIAALVRFVLSDRGRLLQGAAIDADAGLTKTL